MWAGSHYLRHPDNGWWESVTPESVSTCGCRFYDENGTLLDWGTSFFVKENVRLGIPNRLPRMHYVFAHGDYARLLHIDYVVHTGYVKYFDPLDPDFSDDVGPALWVEDVVAIRVRPLLSAVHLFQQDIRPRLLRLREASSLAKALPFMSLRRFQCCSREIRRAVAPRRCDDTWVRACQLEWLTVRANFTRAQMLRFDPAWADTVCYPVQGDLVRFATPPLEEAGVGWHWVAFRVPYGPASYHQGWVHPGILPYSHRAAVVICS